MEASVASRATAASNAIRGVVREEEEREEARARAKSTPMDAPEEGERGVESQERYALCGSSTTLRAEKEEGEGEEEGEEEEEEGEEGVECGVWEW